jgi:hypothetical protein
MSALRRDRSDDRHRPPVEVTKLRTSMERATKAASCQACGGHNATTQFTNSHPGPLLRAHRAQANRRICGAHSNFPTYNEGRRVLREQRYSASFLDSSRDNTNTITAARRVSAIKFCLQCGELNNSFAPSGISQIDVTRGTIARRMCIRAPRENDRGTCALHRHAILRPRLALASRQPSVLRNLDAAGHGRTTCVSAPGEMSISSHQGKRWRTLSARRSGRDPCSHDKGLPDATAEFIAARRQRRQETGARFSCRRVIMMAKSSKDDGCPHPVRLRVQIALQTL